MRKKLFVLYFLGIIQGALGINLSFYHMLWWCIGIGILAGVIISKFEKEEKK
jgi:hypothetical protein